MNTGGQTMWPFGANVIFRCALAVAVVAGAVGQAGAAQGPASADAQRAP
jgi:hypothetical protein